MDFGRFFDFVRKTGYDGTFTVEATAFNREGVVDTEILNGCFEKIRDYMRKIFFKLLIINTCAGR